MSDDLVQYRFLIRLNIHEEDVLALMHRLLEIAEVRVRHLESKEAAFPDAEAQNNHGKEDEGCPACGGFGPAHPIGATQDHCCEWDTDHRTNLTRVNGVLFH
ncbi:hypothetical protein D3C76_1509750 [compost metagenome]